MNHGTEKRLIAVVLPSGNPAVYDILPRHVPTPDDPQSYLYPMRYGTQIAHEKDGLWFNPGGWNPVQDSRAVTNLNLLKEKLWN